jgi:hypothetical protein
MLTTTSNSYKPFTNTAWVRARLCNLQKGCTRLATASDKVYQLLAHGRWFSPDTPASSTTKTGRHDIAEKTKRLYYGYFTCSSFIRIPKVDLDFKLVDRKRVEMQKKNVCSIGNFELFFSR